MSCCESTLNCSAQSNASTEDCIIAYKIFDQCRKQICLTPCLLGPARCARNAASCNEILQEGDIIVPPSNAASVSIDDLCLCKILITKKKENAFRTGYWDVEIKFVFSYTITFRDSDCNFITCKRATSVYTMQATLWPPTLSTPKAFQHHRGPLFPLREKPPLWTRSSGLLLNAAATADADATTRSLRFPRLSASPSGFLL